MGRIRIGVAVVLLGVVSSIGGLAGCATTGPSPSDPSDHLDRAHAPDRAGPADATAPPTSPTRVATPGAPTDAPSTLPELVRHPSSGMRFPALLEGFERDEVNRHDGVGDDVSVGYLPAGRDLPMTVTVYVYPAGGPLADQFRGAKAAILEHRDGAELIGEGDFQLMQAGSLHAGLRAHYLVRDPQGQLPLMVSHLFLFSHGPWFIKFRATFLAEQHEACDDALLRFMAALAFPDLHPGRLASLTPR